MAPRPVASPRAVYGAGACAALCQDGMSSCVVSAWRGARHAAAHPHHMRGMSASLVVLRSYVDGYVWLSDKSVIRRSQIKRDRSVLDLVTCESQRSSGVTVSME